MIRVKDIDASLRFYTEVMNMKLNKNAETKILIVGLGLLGGSYARALKKKGYTVWAIEKKNESVEYALKEGIIDRGSTLAEEEFLREANITVFALYPHIFLDWIREHGKKFPKGAILTDVARAARGGVRGEHHADSGAEQGFHGFAGFFHG